MCNKPILKTGHNIHGNKEFSEGQKRGGLTETTNELTTTMEDSREKGDLLIWGLLQKGTDSVHNMCVGNTETYSYIQRYPRNILQGEDKEKNKMYLETLIHQRQNLCTFIYSMDGLIG